MIQKEPIHRIISETIYMRISLAKSVGITSMLFVAAALGACGNVSHRVAADGASAGQLVWPAPNSVTPMHKDGTFPQVAELRLIKAGMDKQQIMQLIGPPHFSEGVWAVREWNYLFNFSEPSSENVTQCQYKILFDQHKLARSFYWQPASCADRLKQKTLAVKTQTQTQTHKDEVITLSSDALFSFDKYAVGDIKPSGRTQLDALAKKIVAADDDIHNIRINGYTDRLGSDAYNDTLSQRRADTVMNYLAARGIPNTKMTAQGHGENDPMTICAGEVRNASLISCLAPNRRVEVRVDGRAKSL